MKLVKPHRTCVLLTWATLVAAPLAGQPLATGPEIPIVSFPLSYAYGLALAAGTDGGFLAAWIHSGVPNALPFGPDDEPRLLFPVRLGTDVTISRSAPRVSPLASGRYVAVWGTFRQVSPVLFDKRIAGQILDAAGNALGPALPLAGGNPAGGNPPGPSAPVPAVAADTAGGFVVAWEDDGSVAARRFDGEGAPLSVGISEAGEGEAAAVASLPDGGFVVAWASRFASLSPGSVSVRIFRPDGTPAGPAIEVSGGDGRSRHTPRVSAGALGGFIVAWTESEPIFGDDGLWQVRAQRFGPGGERLGPAITVDETGEPNRGFFLGDLAVGAGGGFLVLWTERDAVISSPPVGAWPRPEFRGDVWARAFTAGGAPLGSEFLVPDTAARDQEAGEAEATAAGWIVSWKELDAAGTTILARRHSVSCGGEGALCLNGNRFRAEVSWRTPDGLEGTGTPIPLTGDTGAFWFFQPSNYELVVKLLDGRGVNGHFWVFFGSLTNVEFDLTVTDTATGEQRTYHNPAGTMASRADTEAF